MSATGLRYALAPSERAPATGSHVAGELRLDAETVIPLATEVPARIANVANRKGKIERRYDADLVLMNERFEVERVWGRGRAVGSV